MDVKEYPGRPFGPEYKRHKMPDAVLDDLDKATAKAKKDSADASEGKDTPASKEQDVEGWKPSAKTEDLIKHGPGGGTQDSDNEESHAGSLTPPKDHNEDEDDTEDEGHLTLAYVFDEIEKLTGPLRIEIRKRRPQPTDHPKSAGSDSKKPSTESKEQTGEGPGRPFGPDHKRHKTIDAVIKDLDDAISRAKNQG
jgi:hypothetical protein